MAAAAIMTGKGNHFVAGHLGLYLETVKPPIILWLVEQNTIEKQLKT